MAAIASPQATSAVASIVKACVSSVNAPSEGSFGAKSPMATGPRMATATRPTSDSEVTRALCRVSTGRSRKTRPNAK